MLAVGRALMAGPKLLLLDEPSMGLAPLMAKAIMRTIRSLNEDGVTILLVEQNIKAALKLAHFRLRDGDGQHRDAGRRGRAGDRRRHHPRPPWRRGALRRHRWVRAATLVLTWGLAASGCPAVSRTAARCRAPEPYPRRPI